MAAILINHPNAESADAGLEYLVKEDLQKIDITKAEEALTSLAEKYKAQDTTQESYDCTFQCAILAIVAVGSIMILGGMIANQLAIDFLKEHC